MSGNKVLKQKAEGKKGVGALVAAKKRRRVPVYVWLNIQPEDIWLKVRQGDTIRKALRAGEIESGGDCGGLGKCGKCKIRVLSLVDEPTEDERELLDDIELEQGIRLACRTKVVHDMVISVGEPAAEPEYFQVLTTSHSISGSYIPEPELEPLVAKRLISLPPESQNEGASDLDRIKLALGGEYRGLKASLYCLRTLPQDLEKTLYHGTAVLHTAWSLISEQAPWSVSFSTCITAVKSLLLPALIVKVNTAQM